MIALTIRFCEEIDQDTMHHEDRHGPPGAPEHPQSRAADENGAKMTAELKGSTQVGPLHELPHAGGRHKLAAGKSRFHELFS